MPPASSRIRLRFLSVTLDLLVHFVFPIREGFAVRLASSPAGTNRSAALMPGVERGESGGFDISPAHNEPTPLPGEAASIAARAPLLGRVLAYDKTGPKVERGPRRRAGLRPCVEAFEAGTLVPAGGTAKVTRELAGLAHL